MLAELRDVSFIWNRGSSLERMAVSEAIAAFRTGETCAIIGPTGSGKSTLMQVLAGVLPPTSGQVLFDGKKLSEFSGRKGKGVCPVALSFQYPEEQMCEPTVLEEVAFGPRNLGCSREVAAERSRRALLLAGLDPDEYGERKTFALSGGELRRVAIAGVLAMETEFVILDEPTAGLDPEAREALMERLLSWRQGTGRGLLIVTHDLDGVALAADRVVAMNGGKIVADGDALSVLADAAILNSLGFAPPDRVALGLEFARLRGTTFLPDADPGKAASQLLAFAGKGLER